jgi:transcriptional regulator with XRE-family HTH domain
MTNIGNKEVMANNLRYYLEKSGRSQKELAEIVGVAPSTFNEWMQGKKYPRIDKIELLAKYFGILKSDLIEEKTEDHREMQKKNDVLSDIILKLTEDEELLVMVETLSKLGYEKREAVKSVLNAFSTVDE